MTSGRSTSSSAGGGGGFAEPDDLDISTSMILDQEFTDGGFYSLFSTAMDPPPSNHNGQTMGERAEWHRRSPETCHPYQQGRSAPTNVASTEDTAKQTALKRPKTRAYPDVHNDYSVGIPLAKDCRGTSTTTNRINASNTYSSDAQPPAPLWFHASAARPNTGTQSGLPFHPVLNPALLPTMHGIDPSVYYNTPPATGNSVTMKRPLISVSTQDDALPPPDDLAATSTAQAIMSMSSNDKTGKAPRPDEAVPHSVSTGAGAVLNMRNRRPGNNAQSNLKLLGMPHHPASSCAPFSNMFVPLGVGPRQDAFSTNPLPSQMSMASTTVDGMRIAQLPPPALPMGGGIQTIAFRNYMGFDAGEDQGKLVPPPSWPSLFTAPEVDKRKKNREAVKRCRERKVKEHHRMVEKIEALLSENMNLSRTITLMQKHLNCPSLPPHQRRHDPLYDDEEYDTHTTGLKHETPAAGFRVEDTTTTADRATSPVLRNGKAALVDGLRRLRPSQLRKRARTAGAPHDAIEEAGDAVEPNAAMIALIVSATTTTTGGVCFGGGGGGGRRYEGGEASPAAAAPPLPASPQASPLLMHLLPSTLNMEDTSKMVRNTRLANLRKFTGVYARARSGDKELRSLIMEIFHPKCLMVARGIPYIGIESIKRRVLINHLAYPDLEFVNFDVAVLDPLAEKVKTRWLAVGTLCSQANYDDIVVAPPSHVYEKLKNKRLCVGGYSYIKFDTASNLVIEEFQVHSQTIYTKMKTDEHSGIMTSIDTIKPQEFSPAHTNA